MRGKNIRTLIMLTAIVFMLFGAYSFECRAAGADDVLAYMNAARAEAGLPAYTVDETLQEAATTRATECASRFSHTRPNGKAWYTVSSAAKGENLAHARNEEQSNPENVVLAWLLSPKHQANVMRKSFSSVGIAYYDNGNGDIYIACEFN